MEIQEHAFFNDIDFKLLEEKKIQPPVLIHSLEQKNL